VTDTSFNTLPLSATIQSNLDSLGYIEMTPVQADALPLILSRRDVIGQSETGSGKTVAFALGILNRLRTDELTLQALTLCPTRELATQVAEETRRLARTINNVKVTVLCGGTPIRHQLDSLRHGTHIAIGTPGRVADHLRRESIDLQRLNTFVLDEADRMLDMGFQEEIEFIASHLPDDRQTLLFSATFPNEIKSISSKLLSNPTHIRTVSAATTPNIEQIFYRTTEDRRLYALTGLIAREQPKSCLVFCQTRQQSKDVYLALLHKGYSALALHGEMEQRDRDEALVRFANGSATILVATDVAARGLDINQLQLVINYQLPNDPDNYIHRVGRTGRAGHNGRALSLVTEHERARADLIADMMQQPISFATLPDHDPAVTAAKPASMVTILIQGGKKQKLRPGDILGALTGGKTIEGRQVGKINSAANHTYVAVERNIATSALQILRSNKIKGKSFRARIID